MKGSATHPRIAGYCSYRYTSLGVIAAEKLFLLGGIVN
jgi:hypothetical protein